PADRSGPRPRSISPARRDDGMAGALFLFGTYPAADSEGRVRGAGAAGLLVRAAGRHLRESEGAARRKAEVMKLRRTGSRLYCSYFDSSYLARGIVFLRSLRRRDPKARILVLALDDLCARVLRERFGDEILAIETETLHERFPALRRLRGERSSWAYYATQKPALALFAMESRPQPDALMYVDADTWFFANPS